MGDVFTKQERSRIMAAVRSSGTRPENALAMMFREAGVAANRNEADLPGSPDFVIEGARLVVFVHGCFWHGHNCRSGKKRPQANRDYWQAKIARNMRRDGRVRRALRKRGFAVYIVWTCRMRSGWRPTRILTAIRRRLSRSQTRCRSRG